MEEEEVPRSRRHLPFHVASRIMNAKCHLDSCRKPITESFLSLGSLISRYSLLSPIVILSIIVYSPFPLSINLCLRCGTHPLPVAPTSHGPSMADGPPASASAAITSVLRVLQPPRRAGPRNRNPSHPSPLGSIPHVCRGRDTNRYGSQRDTGPSGRFFSRGRARLLLVASRLFRWTSRSRQGSLGAPRRSMMKPSRLLERRCHRRR